MLGPVVARRTGVVHVFVISLKGLWRPITSYYASAAGALCAYNHFCQLWCSALIALSFDGAEISYAELCALVQADAIRRPPGPPESGAERIGSAPFPAGVRRYQ